MAEKALKFVRDSCGVRERIARAGVRPIEGFIALCGKDLEVLDDSLKGLEDIDLTTFREAASLLFGPAAPSPDTSEMYDSSYMGAVSTLFDKIEGDHKNPRPDRWSGESVARLIAALICGFPDVASRGALAAELGFPIGELPNPLGGIGIICGAGERWVTAADAESANILECLLSVCASSFTGAAKFGAKAYRTRWGAPSPNALADAVRATKTRIMERAVRAIDMNSNEKDLSVDKMIKALAECVKQLEA